MTPTSQVVEPCVSSDRALSVDRWRMRDAALCVDPALVHSIRLDAPAGTAVPLGVVAVAAGIAGETEPAGDPVAAARAHRRRDRVRVTYGSTVAGLGAELAVRSTASGDTVASVVSSDAGVVAEIEQHRSAAAVPDTSAAVEVDTGSLVWRQLPELARVRVARWVYVSGELSPVHGDHVAATAAGLPSVLVPETLLLAIVERVLFRDDARPSGELVVEFPRPAFAGDQLQLAVDHGHPAGDGQDVTTRVLLRTAGGVIAAGTVRGHRT